MVLNPDIPKPTDKAKLLIDSINPKVIIFLKFNSSNFRSSFSFTQKYFINPKHPINIIIKLPMIFEALIRNVFESILANIIGKSVPKKVIKLIVVILNKDNLVFLTPYEIPKVKTSKLADITNIIINKKELI